MSGDPNIPTRSRQLVVARDQNRCVRCRVTVTTGAWHHRRSRSVVDSHQHCPCNGILLCHTCHAWVHAYPFDARGSGWIVTRAQPEPWVVPVQRATGDHWMNLDCYGGMRHTTATSLDEAAAAFTLDSGGNLPQLPE